MRIDIQKISQNCGTQQDNNKIIAELVKVMDKMETDFMEENILDHMTTSDYSKMTGDEIKFQDLLGEYHNEIQV